MTAPELSTVVVAWRSRADVRRLAASFPRSPRHELVVVDNSGELASSDLGEADASRRLLRPQRNLGFGGGCNFGAGAARADLLLFLNPDTEPRGDAFDRLLEAFARWPDAAGVVPRLTDDAGAGQHRWQLRCLPRPGQLLAHALFWNPGTGARRAPPAGTPVEQPAAAALALRRTAFEGVGGFDESFHPAWFEDVDLARRLAAAGATLRWDPAAEFGHRGGASIETLGYGRFLTAYDRNLALYLRRHHGRSWAIAFRVLVPVGALARIIALPLRRPRRATSRRQAARDLAIAALAALRGWPSREPT